jgi:hypothetical protein
MRDRGPKVVREKVKLEFTGGHYGFSRDDPDGTWCDLWLFDDLDLGGYHLFHATRADLLVRLDRPAEAADAYDRALALTANAAEQRFLTDRLDEVRSSSA